MLLLALLKVTVLVGCYGMWRRFSHLVLPRTNVSEGPSEESEELDEGGGRLRYKGVLYVRVAQADTALDDTSAPPLEDGEPQHLHRHQPMRPGEEQESVEMPPTTMTSTATSPIVERVDV